ncbi:hypothetical protein HPB49_014409 [Dermacentor silvarum]|uniref:Uncharacterized protein n=1 Tax=Dermacentor silvarum TaxID=543639 RepID=A0ACB8CFF0_DERSI|nr:hypothetical protein HPB49_014409 [Dermacentor silvarum]
MCNKERKKERERKKARRKERKFQAGTYASIVYDCAKTQPQKLVYVALSRCTNIQNLYLTNASADHRFHHKNDNIDKNIADEFKRLDNHRLDTVTQRYLRAFQEDVDPERRF